MKIGDLVTHWVAQYAIGVIVSKDRLPHCQTYEVRWLNGVKNQRGFYDESRLIAVKKCP
jgi:hypothetical protein